MTTPTTPHLKRPTPTPTQPPVAEPAPASSGRGAPKFAARQGVLTALRPEPHVQVQRLVAWLHVVCPSDRRAPVSAISHCDCGRHLTAHGRPDVIALVHDHAEHRTICPLHTAPERKQAA